MRTMTRLGRRWAAWFDEPAPAARLAVFRIAVVGFTLGYLLVRFPVFASLASDARTHWEPVGVLWWCAAAPSGPVVGVLVAGALVAGSLALAGIAYGTTGPVTAVCMLVLTTIRSSSGQLLWFENLAVLHLLIVAVAPAADVLTWGTRRRVAPPACRRYGWPLRVAAVVTVLTYALAGVAKLRYGGMAWLDGESLGHHIAYSATRLEVLGGRPSPFAAALVDVPRLFGPLAVMTVVLEIGAPIALVARRLVVPWVVGAWLLHAAIAATMFVVFPYPLTMVAFAPLFRLERLVPDRR